MTQVAAGTPHLGDDRGMKSLDVRTLPPRTRHSTIHEMLAEMPPGDILRITNDHDPRPLRLELEHDRPGAFDWAYVESGPEIWQVDIRRVA